MKTTWQCISPAVTVKKFCISSAVSGTDDDMLWNGSEEIGNVQSYCEKGTDCEDGDSEIEQ